MTKQPFITESRRVTPWTGSDNLSTTQAFIDRIIADAYDARHPKLKQSGEAEFINQFTSEDCPYCREHDIVRFGYTRNGICRYRCRSCGRTFTPVTGTIFQDHKISITEWIDFCLALFRNQSFTSISKSNRNSYTTTKYWISKLFLLLEDYQSDIILDGDVYIDETYYKVRKGDIRRNGDKEYRGLSRNQICIAVGCDRHKVYLAVEGNGKTSQKKTLDAFSSHIASGAHLIHDEEKSHKVLVSRLCLTDETYNSKETRLLPDKDNPLNPVNRKCDAVKKFLRAHSGFIREDLQGYLDVFSFIWNEDPNPYRKVEKLLTIAMCCRKTLTFRANYANKHSN